VQAISPKSVDPSIDCAAMPHLPPGVLRLSRAGGIRPGMSHRLPLAFVAILLVAAGPATDRHGYLADGAFDIFAVLPPAPVRGDPRDRADRRIFEATRALVGTPRYALATRDVDYREPALMGDFSCAAGIALTPENAPRTLALVERASVDTGTQMLRAKDFYKRPRPYKTEGGEICQSKADLGDSFDYPSGHTTLGWTWGLVLTDLLPDRATALVARARAFGESRYICGAHNESAVEGGQTTAMATMAAVRTTPAYQGDAAAARAELRALIADPHAAKPQGCDVEAKLVAEHGL
jgi:acid phosphatase (class A)